jgi:hypothetical protein
MPPLTTSHFLLPHERWLARTTLERQQTHRTATVLRIEQKLGPEGNILYLAGLANLLPGGFTVVTGIAFLLASRDRRPLVETANYLIAAGIALALVAGIRYVQSVRAGRAFRSGRLWK